MGQDCCRSTCRAKLHPVVKGGSLLKLVLADAPLSLSIWRTVYSAVYPVRDPNAGSLYALRTRVVWTATDALAI